MSNNELDDPRGPPRIHGYYYLVKKHPISGLFLGSKPDHVGIHLRIEALNIVDRYEISRRADSASTGEPKDFMGPSDSHNESPDDIKALSNGEAAAARARRKFDFIVVPFVTILCKR